MRKGVLDENALFVFNCVQNFSQIFALRLLFNADFRQVAQRETNPVAIFKSIVSENAMFGAIFAEQLC